MLTQSLVFLFPLRSLKCTEPTTLVIYASELELCLNSRNMRDAAAAASRDFTLFKLQLNVCQARVPRVEALRGPPLPPGRSPAQHPPPRRITSSLSHSGSCSSRWHSTRYHMSQQLVPEMAVQLISTINC